MFKWWRINGLVILGSLKFLSDKKILIINKIKNFVGTSIGSLIIFLLLIEYSINDIIQIFYDLNLEKLKVEFDLEDLINNYGIENVQDFNGCKNFIVYQIKG